MRPVTVKEKRLRQPRGNKLYGTYQDGQIHIDPRQDEYQRLDTLLHELIHHAESHTAFEMHEETVEMFAGMFAQVLWREGYRRTPPKK